MSTPELTDRERLAAEYAMRLLEGEELLTARGLMTSDPEFAAEVARWEERLAPLLDETADVVPAPEVWERIESEVGGLHGQPESEVITLRRRLRQWQGATALAAAAAVILGFFATPILQAPPGTQSGTSGTNSAPLMANIPIGDTPLRLAVTYLPSSEEMLVSASGLTADGIHDHELWLLVPDEAPQSLGVVVPGEERRMPLTPALADKIAQGSELILTREPLGGAPAGGEAGPVVAEGVFRAT